MTGQRARIGKGARIQKGEIVSRFGAAWSRAAGDLAVLLILVHLPVAVLFTLPSRLKYMTSAQVAADSALLLLLYASVAAVAGLAIAIIVAAIGRWSVRWADRAMALLTWLGGAIVLIALRPFIAAWFANVLSRPAHRIGTIADGLMIAVAIVVIVVIARKGLHRSAEALSRRLAPARRVVVALVPIALVVVVATGQGHVRPFGWSGQLSKEAPPAAAPDIYLISIDALAAKDMSLYGYRLPTTPELDAFAQHATVFDHYYANSNWTLPTVTSMLTGLYPTTHRATQIHGRLPLAHQVPTLAAMLKAHGYVTAAIVSNPHAHPLLDGFGRDFDYVSDLRSHYAARMFQGALMFDRSQLFHTLLELWFQPFRWLIMQEQRTANLYPSEMVSEPAKAVANSGHKPLFVWTHFLSPHEPYLPPEPYRHRFLPEHEFEAVADFDEGRYFYDVKTQQQLTDRVRLRYDEYIAYTDNAVATMLRELRESGKLDNAIVVITADHGESFEKGWREHGGPMLHDALIHIPLIVQLPGQRDGRRIAANAEQVDLAPTILDLVGLPIAETLQGQSLVPALRGGTLAEKPKFAFELTLTAHKDKPERGTAAVMAKGFKLIHRFSSGCEELYAIGTDPGENDDLSAAQPETATSLRQLLEARMDMPITGRSSRAAAEQGECAWSIADWIPPH